MFPLNHVLAVALLTAPPDAVMPDGGPAALATVRPTLQSLAVAWEVLDPREQRFVLTRDEDFDTDLKLLRRRYQDLADAPPVHDCMRFPTRALINDLLAFNRAYRQHLDNRLALETATYWQLHETLQEADRLYAIWDLVRDARCDYYYVTVRRQALKKLRDTVGYPAYYNGSLPPHVPVWRFARID
jgi:hypothetical protein